MGIITGDNQNSFKSASFIFSKVKRNLSSFDAAGLIDEGEFPTYVKDVLRDLRLGVYKESDAVMEVRNYKAKLPSDFVVLYAAYKCSPFFDHKDIAHQQGNPISVYNDVTWELLQGGENCEIDCASGQANVLEKITVRQFVNEKAVTFDMRNPTLLRISPNVGRERCSSDCQNFFASSPYEITLRDGYVFTNFNNDFLYMKYYSMPLDDYGVPMIPDIESVEKTIEWYIKSQLFLEWWQNGDAPDLERKYIHAQSEYEKWKLEAKYQMKMPSFNTMVNAIRRNRASNKIKVFVQPY